MSFEIENQYLQYNRNPKSIQFLQLTISYIISDIIGLLARLHNKKRLHNILKLLPQNLLLLIQKMPLKINPLIFQTHLPSLKLRKLNFRNL